MSINYLQPLILPEGVSIEENYDDLQAQEDHLHGYTCYRMFYLNKITGYANYKRKTWNGKDYWYILQFQAQLPDSLPGQGHGTYFLKYLVREMYAQDEIIIHTIASNIENPNFPQWLVNRGFKQDNLYQPDKKNSRILLPCDAHYLWNK
ncbi:hypothetical protein ACWATR_28565 [Nostoc sp. UIC 10890]